MYVNGKRQHVNCYILFHNFCENCVYLGECARYSVGIFSTLLPISAYIDNILTIISVKKMIIEKNEYVSCVSKRNFFLSIR